jgi:hypothetical protein
MLTALASFLNCPNCVLHFQRQKQENPMMKLYYAYLADYDSHRSIAICDSLELAKQRCQEHYDTHRADIQEWADERNRRGYRKPIAPLSDMLDWYEAKTGNLDNPLILLCAEFPLQGQFCIREIVLNEAISE